MTGSGERMARASEYVLGLMNDRDRERAERDLEIDPAFRDAVMQLADRMRIFEHVDAGLEDNRWRLVADHIATLPQMRLSSLDGSDRLPPPAAGTPTPPRLTALPGAAGARAWWIAAAIALAFAFGYAAGRLGP